MNGENEGALGAALSAHVRHTDGVAPHFQPPGHSTSQRKGWAHSSRCEHCAPPKLYTAV